MTISIKSHSATVNSSTIPPAPGYGSFSLDRTFTPPTFTPSTFTPPTFTPPTFTPPTFTPPTIIHDTHPVCLSVSTPDFQVHSKDWTTTNSRTVILENGQPVNEEESCMTKSNPKATLSHLFWGPFIPREARPKVQPHMKNYLLPCKQQVMEEKLTYHTHYKLFRQ